MPLNKKYIHNFQEKEDEQFHTALDLSKFSQQDIHNSSKFNPDPHKKRKYNGMELL